MGDPRQTISPRRKKHTAEFQGLWRASSLETSFLEGERRGSLSVLLHHTPLAFVMGMSQPFWSDLSSRWQTRVSAPCEGCVRTPSVTLRSVRSYLLRPALQSLLLPAPLIVLS